ncbi:MAG: hypothetical protein K2Y15_04200 [Burkholderiaceae bacterium]|nr:hypothetical protein [Burkholderiaceae bacterium]
MLVMLLAGCASDPVIRGMGQEEAKAFIISKVGTQVPSNVQLARHYKENYTKTTDTEFICNRSSQLERVTNYTVTRVSGNYVAIDASHYEDCDRGVTRYKLDGWFDQRYLYLRSAGSATTHVYVMEIEEGGRKLTDVGNYRYVDGALSWQRHVRNGEKRSTGGYHYTTGYVAQADASGEQGEYSSMLQRSQQARRDEPSTASQIAQFSSLLAGQLNQQSAIRAREQAAALERQNQLRAAEAATARRNQQLLAAAAASRSSSTTSSSQNTLQPSVSASGGMSSRSATNATATALASAERERQAAQQREQEERQRVAKAAADKAAADRAAAEKAASEERKARREAEKKAEAEAKARAEQDYLQRLAAGTRMGAKNCYGEQHVMGAMPNIKPKTVACIDMHFRAYCQGSHPGVAYQGVLKNMVSMGTGCFGDTVEIKPKLGCKAEDIRVEVTQARPCS